MRTTTRVLVVLIAVMMLVTLAGCDAAPSSANTDWGSSEGEGQDVNESADQAESDSEEEAVSEYEYVFRDLPEPVYIEAAASFAGGTGTESDPYQISNATELALLSEKTNQDFIETDFNEYNEAYYILTEDIELNDTSNYEDWETQLPQFTWKPISMSYYGGFLGSFDGNNHTISGMYINYDHNDVNSDSCYGLFADCHGDVKNLKVEDSYICVSGFSSNVGTIAGSLWTTGSIQNCQSTATIICYDATVGGIVGHNYSLVSDCAFNGSIVVEKEESYSNCGGICGSAIGNESRILNCINKGTIVAESADTVSGIVGWTDAGSIVSCTNEGDISGGGRTGGIAGLAYISNIGGEESESKGIVVEQCANKGVVSGSEKVGGVIAHCSNDNSDYDILISECTNSGQVNCDISASGIVGSIHCDGAGITVSECENSADIICENAAGVIGTINMIKGVLNISGCKNTGHITGTQLYAGGIVSSFYCNPIFSDDDEKIAITMIDCSNTGQIETQAHGGGILGMTDNPTPFNSGSTFQMVHCTNTGEVSSKSTNGFIGGIIGGYGFNRLDATFEKCTNTGTLVFSEFTIDEETKNSEGTFTLSLIAGGIIGRVGETLLLTTDADEKSNDYIGIDDAFVKIVSCFNSGEFNVPNEAEDITSNEIGGIVGNVSGDQDFSLTFVDCYYANTERGLGTKVFTDMGTAVSEDKINAMIN